MQLHWLRIIGSATILLRALLLPLKELEEEESIPLKKERELGKPTIYPFNPLPRNHHTLLATKLPVLR